MWYSEVLYQELNGSDGHPYCVSRFLLMRHLPGCPPAPCGKGKAENLKLLLTQAEASTQLRAAALLDAHCRLVAVCCVIFRPELFLRGGCDVLTL